MNEQRRREQLLEEGYDEEEVEDALDRRADDEIDRRRDDALLSQVFKP